MLSNYSQPLEFTKLLGWLDTTLKANMPEVWANLIEFVIVAVAFLTAYAVIALILIYAER